MSKDSRCAFQNESSSARSEWNRWAIVLAGGDGTRLRTLTRSISGDDRPKQFCPLIGGRTLLDQTRSRVELSIPSERTLFVVTAAHERFFKSLAASVAPTSLVIQPSNKGTAPALLYSLMRVAAVDPCATVAIFPSDHHFADDETFMSFVETAFDRAQAGENEVILLGIRPQSPEIEFGWIEPYESILASLPKAVTRVRRFWEKPTLNLASKLMDRGCLWNSFVMIGRVSAFLRMTKRALPELYSNFEAVVPFFNTKSEASVMRELYAWTPEINFSHEVLAMRPDDLSVMTVDDVGWSDLGEPSRVLATLGRIGTSMELVATAS